MPNGIATQVNGRNGVVGSALIPILGRPLEVFVVARYNPDGNLDTSFDADDQVSTDFGASDDASEVAIQAPGKLAAERGSDANFALARYNADGSLDTGFDTDGKVTTDFGGSEGATSLTI